MTDVFTKKKRSEVMAAIRSRDNKETEKSLAALFRKHRIRGWRRHLPLEGKPDFTFPNAELTVFVDGCFWHGCPKHYRLPTSNRVYWKAKIERNRARDRSVTRTLRLNGWKVLRIWQHDLGSEHKVIKRILAELSERTVI